MPSGNIDQEFMELVCEVNPLMNFVHHSLLLSSSTEAEKSERREATRVAYRWIVFLLRFNKLRFYKCVS